MEFFRIVDIQLSEEVIQEQIILKDIENFSNQIFLLGDPDDSELSIGSIWGEFTLVRQTIKGGVRFALKECPNALTWTLTTGYPPKRDAVIIHLTINRERKDQQFVDEILEFLDDHSHTLKMYFN